MKITIEIALGNDTMKTYNDIGRVISKLCAMEFIDCPHAPRVGEGYPIRDNNGNRVGNWDITD